jgi:hypothetical protein
MEEYPSNSKRVRETPTGKEKIERITVSEPIRKKKSLGKRFAETFVGGDTRNVGQYVMFDVLLPALRDMIVDGITMGAERMFFPDSAGRRRPSRSSIGSGYTPYNKIGGTRYDTRPDPRGVSRSRRPANDFDDIIMPTRHEAADVLDKLFDLVQKYESASVSDLYDLIGVTPAYTDDKWGWTNTNLQGADIRRTRDGYLIDLPRPEPLA